MGKQKQYLRDLFYGNCYWLDFQNQASRNSALFGGLRNEIHILFIGYPKIKIEKRATN